jgi:hypothetical protein
MQVGQRLDMFSRNPQQDMMLSGSTSLLIHLAACSLRPFLDAFTREPIAAVQSLASLASGPGANYIVQHAASLRYQMWRSLEHELRHNASLRHDIEQVMVGIDTIYLVRQRLHGSYEEWFSNLLASELNAFPATEFLQLRRRLRDRWKSFYDIFRELRQRRGRYTHEDLILLYVGLNDSASGVRAEAARRLGEYAWVPPEKLVSRLIHVALYDQGLETRNAAARALGALGDRVVSPTLLETVGQHLVSPDRFVRSSSALLLAALGELGATDELIARLIALLRDNDAYAREAAACALGRMGATAAMRQGVLESLTRALEDTSEDVHAAALSSLTHLREVRASEPAASPVPPIGPTPDYSPSGPAMEPTEPAPETPVESPTEFLELGR